jgi:hypothetical protein
MMAASWGLPAMLIAGQPVSFLLQMILPALGLVKTMCQAVLGVCS